MILMLEPWWSIKAILYSPKLRNDTDSFYNYFVKHVMQYDNDVLLECFYQNRGSGDKEFKKALTAYLRQRIGEHKIKKFKFTDSEKTNLIQLSRYGCWRNSQKL